MTTDPTVRILWFDDTPHPISAYPHGLEGGGKHWYVQTRDGEWHAVIPRAGEVATKEDRTRLDAAVQSWLADYYANDGRPR